MSLLLRSCISSVDGASLLFIDRVVVLAVMLRQVRTVQTVHFIGLVIDMPVIVHVKVVDIYVVAQRQFPLVQQCRPLSFSICSSVTRCSMSVGRSSIFGCRLGEDSHDPTVATRHVRAWTRSFTRPLCATTDARCFSVQKTAMYRSCCSRVCGADRGVMPKIMEIVQVSSLLDWVMQVRFWRLQVCL